MDVETAIARVDEIFAEEFELEAERIVPTATLRDDLGLDSLDALDLIVLIEKEFGVRLDDEELKTMATIAEVHAAVRAKFAEAAEVTTSSPRETAL